MQLYLPSLSTNFCSQTPGDLRLHLASSEFITHPAELCMISIIVTITDTTADSVDNAVEGL